MSSTSHKPSAWRYWSAGGKRRVYCEDGKPAQQTPGAEPLYSQETLDAAVAAERFGWEQLARGALEVMENHRSEHAQGRIAGLVHAFKRRLSEGGPNDRAKLPAAG